MTIQADALEPWSLLHCPLAISLRHQHARASPNAAGLICERGGAGFEGQANVFDLGITQTAGGARK
jgi:hypothetical protein